MFNSLQPCRLQPTKLHLIVPSLMSKWVLFTEKAIRSIREEKGKEYHIKGLMERDGEEDQSGLVAGLQMRDTENLGLGSGGAGIE